MDDCNQMQSDLDQGPLVQTIFTLEQMKVVESLYPYKQVRLQILRRIGLIQIPSLTVHSVAPTHLALHLSFPCEELRRFEITSVSFLLILTKGYPLTPPFVHLLTTIPSLIPSINDPRDLLEDILKQKYHGAIGLDYICNRCQLFMRQLLQKSQGKPLREVGKLGKYHLGRTYSYRLMKLTKTCSYFYVQGYEYNVEEQECKTAVILGISETHFLAFKCCQQPYLVGEDLFWPREDELEDMHLIFFADIECLYEMDISRKGCLVKLYFRTVQIKPSSTRSLPDEPRKDVKYHINTIKSYKLSLLKEFSTHIIRTAKRFSTSIQFEPGQSEETSEQDVVLAVIAKKEAQLKTKFNKRTVEEVHEAYQLAVEMYSNMGLGYYEVYLAKIAEMYSREDVKVIMIL